MQVIRVRLETNVKPRYFERIAKLVRFKFQLSPKSLNYTNDTDNNKQPPNVNVYITY